MVTLSFFYSPMKHLLKIFPFVLFFLLSITQSFGQFADETDCSNGIDDGGDGFVDCFDNECSTDDACAEFFFGNNVTCSSPPSVTSFSIQVKWGSDDQTANSHASPLVGDLDRDGIPEVVVNNRANNTVTILNGENGTIYRQFILPFPPENVMALANVTNTDCAYILVYEDRGNEMLMLDCELNIVWSATTTEYYIGNPAFADFNQDGIPELYHKNEIRNAVTGDLLVDGASFLNAGETWLEHIVTSTVAIDLFDENEVVDGVICTDCQGLELAAGRFIYSVNITTGTLTEIKDINDDIGINPTSQNRYFPKVSGAVQHSGVSVADYNQDGSMDILMSGALGSDYSGQTTIFFWDVTNGTVLTYADVGNNHSKGTGRLNIADLDGDGRLNVNYVSNDVLYSLDENLNLLWAKNIAEGSSGFTGCTLFDFDDDGTVETIYRSEDQLFILDGTDGSTRVAIPCISRTQEEYPVVADVDGDGASEICVTCYTSDLTNFNPYGNSRFSHVRVFGASSGESWQPSRSVWNQSSYFNVNINDDLTVPIQQQDHSVVFSNGICTSGANTALNSFMVQSPIINEEGCSNYVTPDLMIGPASSITTTNSQCPEVDFDVTFSVMNVGDVAVSGSFPVSFYAGDPFVAGSTLLNTITATITNLDIGQTISFTEVVEGFGGDFTLYIVLNDAGAPPPITFTPASIPECGDEENNVGSIAVISDPFTLTVEKINDNRLCDLTLPNNGEARAYYNTDGTQNFTEANGFSFDWYDAADVGLTTILHNGSTYPAMAHGDYLVRSYYTISNCFSAVQSITIGLDNSTDFFAYAYEVSPLTDCTTPNGEVTAFAYTFEDSPGVPGDTLTTGYTFTWTFTAGGVTTLGTAPTLSDLDANQYRITVEDNLTGCTGSFDVDVTTSLVDPRNIEVVTTPVHIITCGGGTGEISAFVDDDPGAGVTPNTTDYTFEWYNGTGINSTADFIGVTYTGLPEGSYTVQAIQNGTSCSSLAFTETILNNSTDPESTSISTDNTTCNIIGNGGIIVDPDGDGSADPSDYTYEWYASVNTLPGNILPAALAGAAFGAGQWEMTGLKSNTYTIIVTETATGCSTTFTEDVIDNFVEPEFTISNPVDTENSITIDNDGYISIPQALSGLNAVTISYWAYLDGANYGNDERIFSSGSIDENQVLLWSDNSNGLSFVVKTNSVGRGRINSFYAATGWTQVIGTWDGTTGDMNLYGNGVLLGSSNFVGSGDLVNAGPIMYIGRDDNGSINKFEGEIDEFRIYNKALSVDEINSQMCTELTGNEDGLIIYYDFNSSNISGVNNGATVFDQASAGGSINGTIVEPGGATEIVFQTGTIECPITGSSVNTSCDAGNPNGSIDVSAFVMPNSTYTYHLYDGFSISSELQSNSTGIFTGLTGGFYTVTAEDDITQCTTIPATLSISNIPDNPNIITVITDDANCDGASSFTGAIAVTSTSNASTSLYTYELFDGASFSTSLNVQNNINGTAGFTFTGLENGTYRIRVTNENLTCDGVIDVQVGDATVEPMFTVGSPLIINNTSCIAGNGSISVQIDGDLESNYNFAWYDGGIVGVELRSADLTNSIGSLTAGIYTVVATHRTTNCETIQITGEIFDTPTFPTISIVSQSAQTDCASGDGTVQVQIDDLSGVYGCTGGTFCNDSDIPMGFSYQWFTGSGTVSPLLGQNSTSISGLAFGIYTFEVTDPLGCANTQEVTISLSPINPTLSLNGTATANTTCDLASFNGAVTVRVAFNGEDPVADLSGYIFTWYNGTGMGKVLNPSSTTETLSGLQEGDYSVEVDAPNSCTSDIIVVTVPANLAVISDNGVIDQQLTVCVGGSVDPNGQITITPSTASGEPVGGYDIQWYFGSGTSNTLDVTDLVDPDALSGTSGSGVATLTVTGLEAGTYTVEIINVDTQCSQTTEFTINDNSTTPTFTAPLTDVTAVDMTDCDGGSTYPNGGLSIDLSAITGSGNYTVNYYYGSSVLVANQLDVSGATDIFTTKGTSNTAIINITETTNDTTSATLTGIDPGNYTIEVFDQNTGCLTTPVTVTVVATPTTFTPNITITSNQTSCDLGTPNGSLAASIAVGASIDINDYSFQWYSGQSTNSSNQILTGLNGTNNSIVTNLPTGIYTLLAREINSNCLVTVEETIVLDTENPIFSSAPTPSPSSSCTTPNGSIAFTVDAGVDGNGDLFDGTAGYTVELFDGATIGATEPPLSVITAMDLVPISFSNLSDRTFSIRATDNNTQCLVESLGIVVGYSGVTVMFDESLFFRQDISSCFDQDGIIDVGMGMVVNNIYNDGDQINITWFAGTDTSDVTALLANLHIINPNLNFPVDFQDIIITDGDGDNITVVNGRIGDGDLATTGGLPAISYTAVVDLPNGCIEVFSTILTLGTAPNITIAQVNPTRCAALFDGEISITLEAQPGNNPTQYDYFVFEGYQTILPDADLLTPYEPTLSSYNPIVTGTFSDATDGATELVDFNDNPILGQLEAGVYTIGIDLSAIDNCIVFVGTITLVDPPEPVITLNSSTNNAICDVTGSLSYNGQITVDTDAGFAGNFDFTWYEDFDDDGTYDALLAGNGSGASLNVVGETTTGVSTNITGLGAGKYRVIGIHDDAVAGTACPDTLDIELFDELVTLSVGSTTDDWNLSHIDDCTGASSLGEFTLMRILHDGAVNVASDTEAEIQTDYTLSWTNVTTATPFTPNISETEADDLTAADYQIDIVSDLTGCITSYAFTIIDNSVNPIINLTTSANDTFCDNTGNVGNGAVTIEIDDEGSTATLTDFSVEWYRGILAVAPGLTDPDFIANDIGNAAGANVGTAVAGGDILTLTGLATGTYTVFIDKNNGGISSLGCTAVTTITVDSMPDILSVNATTSYTVMDNDNCTPLNGSIIINEVILNGVPVTLVDASPYTITWTSIGTGVIGTSNPGTSIANNQLTGFSAGTYSFNIQSTLATGGCTTGTIDVVIEDLQVNPVATLSSKTVSTFCNSGTPNNGNGTLNVNIFERSIDQNPPNNYTVIWYRGNSTAGADEIFPTDGGSRGTANINADLTELTELSQGFYTVTIEKTAGGSPGFGCTFETAFEIIQMEDIPSLDASAITAAKVDNTNCVPNAANFNGSITIADADISGGDLRDFTITIERDAVGSGVLVFGPASPTTTSITASDLEAGEYFISAQNTTTSCEVAVVRVNIENMNFSPTIQLVSLVDNLNCGGGDMVGSITITSDGVDETDPNYTFQWYTGPGTAFPIALETNASLTNLSAGVYTVSVDRMSTMGCTSTQEFTISDVPDNPIIVNYEASNQTFCTTNGGFVLLEVLQAGVLLNETDMDAEGYVLEVFRESDDFSIGTAISSPYEIISLPIDNYYATITNNGSSCTSDQVGFEIEEAIINPVLELTVTQNDDPCSLANGEMIVTADGQDDTNTDYTFTWYAYDNGTMTRGAMITMGSTLREQIGGFYEAEVTYSATGCTVSSVGELFENDQIDPVIAAFTIIDATICIPPDGSITIDEMNLDTPQEYVFDLYDENPDNVGATPIVTLPVGTDPVLFSVLSAQTYYISATHGTRGCMMPTVLEVIIEDISTPPVIVFTAFETNTRCNPTIPNGSITAEADGSTSTDPTTGYTWAWAGVDQSGGAVATLPNSATITDIPAGTYNLTITNNATGCSTIANPYVLADESPMPLNISVSTSTNTNCVNFNGKMAATVIQPYFPLDEYDYLWYNGVVVNPDLNNPDYTGSLIENLQNGQYTLVVRDTPINDICQSVVINVVIDDDRNIDFVPIVDIIKDVTFCYASLPNGHAQITNESLSEYSIEWFMASDLANNIKTGFFVDSLTIGNYQVKMTNLISRCEFTTDFVIIDATDIVDNPSVTFISNNTNCTFPNGEANATVNSITESLLFEWFDAADIGLTTVLLTGNQHTSLTEGSYIVRATNLITGCVSGTTPITIEQVITNPIFEIDVTNSLCLRTEDGSTNQFNGDAYIRFTSFNFVDSAAWFDENGTRITYNTTGEEITDGAIGNLSPGDYTVNFRADNGCDYSAGFSINTAIRVFNFVTVNGDSRNDFFLIDCLDSYPNNNVQIFTRAGQKVFDVDGYDNFENRFNGTSEKGQSLPSGTYFYVIDKGDGSGIVQGYLELVQ